MSTQQSKKFRKWYASDFEATAPIESKPPLERCHKLAKGFVSDLFNEYQIPFNERKRKYLCHLLNLPLNFYYGAKKSNIQDNNAIQKVNKIYHGDNSVQLNEKEFRHLAQNLEFLSSHRIEFGPAFIYLTLKYLNKVIPRDWTKRCSKRYLIAYFALLRLFQISQF